MFYASAYKIGQDEYKLGVYAREEPEKYLEDIYTLNQNGRVWFLFAHSCSWCIVDEEQYILNALDLYGAQLDSLELLGASVYLYENRYEDSMSELKPVSEMPLQLPHRAE